MKFSDFVFVHIPRTGGTSVESVLARHFLGLDLREVTEQQAAEYYLPRREHDHQHAKLASYDLSGIEFIFTFVRNPWSWAISEIRYLIDQTADLFHGNSFKEDVRRLVSFQGKIWKHDFEPQVKYLQGDRPPDFIGRFENLQKDFNRICQRLGLPNIDLPHVFRTGVGADWRDAYDAESAGWIAERYAEDIAAFGYRFDSESCSVAAARRSPAESLAEGERRSSEMAAEDARFWEKYRGLKQFGWYLDELRRWRRFYGSTEPRKILEIGAFDGASANLMLEVLFPHPDSELHCIDSFAPDETTPQVDETTRELFIENAAIGGHVAQIHLNEGLSVEVLAWMIAEDGYWESFDFIYVDGSHFAMDVLTDAVLAWPLLKPVGVMIFDDYRWTHTPEEQDWPGRAVNAFLQVFGHKCEILEKGQRVGLRKHPADETV